MKAIYAKYIILFCFFSAASFSSAENNLGLPTSVKEAVFSLTKNMSEKDKEYIKYTPKADLPKFHFSYGLEIRNSFGLLGENKRLLKSAGSENMHPDDASMVILEALWEELRSEMDPRFRENLERIEKSAKNVNIGPFEYKNMEMLEVVTDLNKKINHHGALNIVLSCECGSILINYKEEKEIPLNLVLSRIEFQSGLRLKYGPEYILFDIP